MWNSDTDLKARGLFCNCKTLRNLREGSFAAESCEHIACILGFNKEIAVIALAPGVSAFI